MGRKKREGLVARQSGLLKALQAVCISMSRPYLAPELGHPHTALPSGCPSLRAQPSFVPLTRGSERVGKICHLHQATAPKSVPGPHSPASQASAENPDANSVTSGLEQ